MKNSRGISTNDQEQSLHRHNFGKSQEDFVLKKALKPLIN